MSNILILFAVLVVSSFAQSNSTTNQSGIFQALKQTEGGFNIGDWDGSRILSPQGDVLATVTIKDGKLDFSRAQGQTRTALLKSLYKAGLRRVYISIEQFLVVSPAGHIGPAAAQNDLFQALKETDGDFDLNTFEHSSILDSNGNVLVTLTLRNTKVTLSLAPGQSLETLYELGLRSFSAKSGQVVRLVKDDQGKVVLKEKEDSPKLGAQSREMQQPPSQETKQPTEAQATAQVEVLSTRVINEVTSSITNQRWTPADPSKNRGIIVSVRLARGFGYSAKDFALAFKSLETEQKVMSIGHTASPPGGWLFAEGGAEWSFFPGEVKGKPTIDMSLLFLLPIDVKEVTLIYKDKPVGKPITIKQD